MGFCQELNADELNCNSHRLPNLGDDRRSRSRIGLVRRGSRRCRTEGGEGAARRAVLKGEVVESRSILWLYHDRRRSFHAPQSASALACKQALADRMRMTAWVNSGGTGDRSNASASPLTAKLTGPEIQPTIGPRLLRRNAPFPNSAAGYG